MVVACKTYVEASAELHRQIAETFGSGDEVLDFLTIQPMPVRHEGSDYVGKALVAYPTNEGANSTRLLVVYYGDPPGAAATAKAEK